MSKMQDEAMVMLKARVSAKYTSDPKLQTLYLEIAREAQENIWSMYPTKRNSKKRKPRNKTKARSNKKSKVTVDKWNENCEPEDRIIYTD